MKYISIFVTVLGLIGCQGVQKTSKKTNLKPKLVVGIVVDQMRYDYLTRFESKYGTDGFKRLINQGFNCKEHHFTYMPTFTGPGHASVFTGTTPQIHGIIANDWYHKDLKKYVYCVEDTLVKSVGGDFKKEKRSPRNLLVTTLADQIKNQTLNKGKTIGISIKDRGAVLPAGKYGDAAYWYKGGKDGLFISSTYYMEDLPNWVQEFNAKELPKKYLNQNWETLLPIEEYTESNPDNSPYEESLAEGKPPVFPYDLQEIAKNVGYSLIKTTPFGNDLLLDFAKEAVLNEELGKDADMDFLSISFSSPDYIGHDFGPKSIEVEDTYLRLDRNIADLLHFLDTEVGEGEYIIFLTADHGVAQVTQELIDNGVGVGYFDAAQIYKVANEALVEKYHESELIENYSNFQFFLNKEKIKSLGINESEITALILETVLTIPGVKSGHTRDDLNTVNYSTGINKLVQLGWNTQRSGDVTLVMEPGWLPIKYAKKGGTGHGSPWAYDTHVPLLLYGYGIPTGSTSVVTHVEDIVPTVSTVIGVQAPMGCTGRPISEVNK